MRTYMLVKKDTAGKIIDLAGPCAEYEIFHEDDLEIIDELIFKTLYPEAYRELLLKDLAPAIYIWIDQLYDHKKDLLLESNSVTCNEFVVQISLTEIHIMFYCNCLPAEAAKLVLHLKHYIFDDIPITVTEIPLFLSNSCEN